MKKRMITWLSVALAIALLLGVAQGALAQPVLVPRPGQHGAMDKAALKGIKMSKSTLKVALSETCDGIDNLTRYVKPVPSGAELPQLSWSSSNDAIISVDGQGVVTYKGAGKARITATTPEGKRASIVITVAVVRVQTVRSSGTITLGVGEQATVGTTVLPENATYKTVRFSSTNASVATVSGTGVVTAHAPGVCTINVAADEPGKEKSAETTVQVRSGGGGVSLTISAVGDITLGGDPERGTYQTFRKYLDQYEREYGDRWGSMLRNAAVYFRQDDLTLANLECSLTKSGARPEKKYVYKGLPEYANILSASSVEAVNIANNHATRYGSSGYRSTKNALNNVGVAWNGSGFNERRIITVNGLRVGLLGFQTGGSNNATAIRKACEKMRPECDVLIASLHFGDTPEYHYAVRGNMKTYARTAVANGADLVVGHHPHVISGMENYRGKNIVYGLGTFLAGGPNPIRPRRTFIFQETIVVYPDFVEIKNAKVIPFWITSSEKTNDRMPQPAPGAEADAIISTIEKYSIGQKVDYQVIR